MVTTPYYTEEGGFLCSSLPVCVSYRGVSGVIIVLSLLSVVHFASLLRCTCMYAVVGFLVLFFVLTALARKLSGSGFRPAAIRGGYHETFGGISLLKLKF